MSAAGTWPKDGIERFPIETAPRDGSLIYVSDPDVGEFSMRWCHIQRNDVFAPGVIGMWAMGSGAWTWTDHEGNGPTLWRPIP